MKTTGEEASEERMVAFCQGLKENLNEGDYAPGSWRRDYAVQSQPPRRT